MGEDNKLRRAGANPSDVWFQYDPRVRSDVPRTQLAANPRQPNLVRGRPEAWNVRMQRLPQ